MNSTSAASLSMVFFLCSRQWSVFALVDCFDTVGTLIGTAGNAGMLDSKGNLPGGDRALIADAVATCAGACLGTSTVTTYVESSAGISEGARTGLSSIVIAVLFILALFVTPIFDVLGENAWIIYAATTPALVIVGVLMMKGVAKIAWDNIEDAIPCFLTIVMMPFAYSISDGNRIRLHFLHAHQADPR